MREVVARSLELIDSCCEGIDLVVDGVRPALGIVGFVEEGCDAVEAQEAFAFPQLDDRQTPQLIGVKVALATMAGSRFDEAAVFVVPDGRWT